MINRIPLLIGFVFGLFIDGLAQNEEKKVSVNPDFHFRSFWMNTHYPGQDYKEDYALGMSFNLGAVLNYDQKWKLHLGYRTFANITSSEIGGPDPRTGQPNRYETGLFDLLDTEDKFFGKLETFSLEYSTKKNWNYSRQDGNQFRLDQCTGRKTFSYSG